MRQLFIALSLFLFFLKNSPAQTVILSEAMSIRNDYGYEIIGRLREQVLIFRDRYGEFEVQAFDERLQFSWSKELDDIGRRGTQILGVVGSKNDFSVIFKSRHKGSYSLKVHKYDPGANLIDTMTVKNYGARAFDPPLLDIVRSDDQNCIAVFNTGGHNEMEITCFRLDKMQRLWDQKLNLEKNLEELTTKNFALGNAGEFYFVAEEDNRKGKMEDHRLTIHHIFGEQASVTKVPLPEFLSRDLFFVFDNKHRRLIGAGLFSEKSRDRANGSFYLTLPVGSTAATVRSVNFDDKFISILKGKEVEDDTKGINDTDIQQVVLREDGGVVLIGELHHEVQRGATSARGMWRDGVRMVVDYYYDDIFSIGIQPDGSAQWRTVLHKKQYSQDDEATFSSFFLMRMRDRLRFLFNDEIKFENTCSEYVISPDGVFDRNGLLSTENQKLRLRFRDGLQISANECLIPSEYRNKLRLVLLRY